VHLGSRQSGGAAPAFGAEEEAFARLIDLALEISVDGLLIAGDLFDSARVGEAVVDWTATQLNRLDCEAVVLPGNHDALLPGSPYELHDFAARCDATTVISDHGGELVSLLDGRVVVWGRPVVDHAPWFRPLHGVPPRPRDCFAVVVAHGLFVDEDEEETVRGSPIYGSELERLDWDYVALGHWPRYREVRETPPAIYAGELAGGPRHHGSAVVVSFANGRVSSRRRCF
jgi:DNA repair exonuclease SbcCD nuclease subunit